MSDDALVLLCAGYCRRSSREWQAWQQRLGGQHVAVAVWTWQASLVLPDNQGDFGRILPAKSRTSVGRRLVTVAGVTVPEVKCELDLYEYVLVQTKYVLLPQVRT
jgi:hypothetical protein